MKLYKKLLPIASLTSIATIVTPTIVSCGTKVIELDEYFSSDYRVGLKTSKTINIKTEKEYEINVDLSKIISPTSNDGGIWFLAVSPNIMTDDFITVKPIDVRVWVDDIELEQVEKFDKDKPNAFMIDKFDYSRENNWVIAGNITIFGEKSKMKVTTSFEEKKDDCFIYFLKDKFI